MDALGFVIWQAVGLVLFWGVGYVFLRRQRPRPTRRDYVRAAAWTGVFWVGISLVTHFLNDVMQAVVIWGVAGVLLLVWLVRSRAARPRQG